MIKNLFTYIANLLPVSLRKPKVIALIRILFACLDKSNEELQDYFYESGLRGGGLWQTAYLEFYLSSYLGYAVEITEGDGLPFDFVVYNVSPADTAAVTSILNRYTLLGRSFTFDNIGISGRWVDEVCSQGILEELARWRDEVCVQGEVGVVAKWVDGVCHQIAPTSTGRWEDAVCAQIDQPENVVFTVHLLLDPELSGTIGGTLRTETTAGLMGEWPVSGEGVYTLSVGPGSHRVRFDTLLRYVGSGNGIALSVRWSLNADMSNSKITKMTDFYSDNKNIYVELS